MSTPTTTSTLGGGILPAANSWELPAKKDMRMSAATRSASVQIRLFCENKPELFRCNSIQVLRVQLAAHAPV
jgi:hypothetical protein